MKLRCLLIIFPLAFLSACFHASNSDDSGNQEDPSAVTATLSKTGYVSVNISDGPSLEITNADLIDAGMSEISWNSDLNAYVRDSKRFGIQLRQQQSLDGTHILFNFSVSIENPVEQSKELIYAHALIDEYRYLHSPGANEHTQASVTFTRIDDDSDGRVEGEYTFDLCYIVAINANTCHLRENRILISGRFDVARNNNTLLQPEGTLTAPKEISRAEEFFEYSTLLATHAPGFYITQFTSGSDYRFFVEKNADQFTVEFFSDASFKKRFCALGKNASANECIVEQDKNIYLKLAYLGEHEGAYIPLHASRVTSYVSEGTESAPVTLTDTTHAGQVPGEQYSFYRIDTTPGQILNIGIQEAVYSSVFGTISDSDQTDLCSFSYYYANEITDESCTVVADGTELLLDISAYNKNGSSFVLKVSEQETQWPDQGSDAPHVIEKTIPFSFEGTVFKKSVYAVNVEPEQNYVFSIPYEFYSSNSLSFDIEEDIANESETQTAWLCRGMDYRGNTDCVFSPTTNQVRITVSNYGRHPTPFTLNAKKLETPLNSDESQFIDTLPPVEIAGTIRTSTSRYYLPLTPGKTYTVTLSGDNASDLSFNAIEKGNRLSLNKMTARGTPPGFGEWTRSTEPFVIVEEMMPPPTPIDYTVGFKQMMVNDQPATFELTLVTDKSPLTANPYASETSVMFSEEDYSSTMPPVICRSGFVSLIKIACSFVATSDAVEIKVENDKLSAGATYTLEVAESDVLVLVNEGSPDTPVDLGNSPVSYTGQVGALNTGAQEYSIGIGTSYYRVSLLPNTTYDLVLKPVDASIGLKLITQSDNDWPIKKCTSWLGIMPIECQLTTTADETELRIEVTAGYYNYSQGSRFALSIREAN